MTSQPYFPLGGTYIRGVYGMYHQLVYTFGDFHSKQGTVSITHSKKEYCRIFHRNYKVTWLIIPSLMILLFSNISLYELLHRYHRILASCNIQRERANNPWSYWDMILVVTRTKNLASKSV